MSKQQEVLQILQSHPRNLSKSAIVALMANIDVETGGSFDYQQRQYGGGPGYGLFQIEDGGDLRDGYDQFLKEEGRKDSAKSQIDYVIETLYGKYQNIPGAGHARRVRNAFEGTPEEATEMFMREWERPGVPHLDKRVASAQKFAEMVAEPEQPVQAAPTQDTYTIQPGDTLYQIAAERGLDAEDLMIINRIQNATKIQPGQEIILRQAEQPQEEEDSLMQAIQDAYDYGKSQLSSFLTRF